MFVYRTVLGCIGSIQGVCGHLEGLLGRMYYRGLTDQLTGTRYMSLP